MITVFDCIKYKNIPYSQLQNDKDIEKIQRFVKKLEEGGYDKIILSFEDERNFDIREDIPGYNFESTFPEDLVKSMMSIWLHLDEKEYPQR